MAAIHEKTSAELSGTLMQKKPSTPIDATALDFLIGSIVLGNDPTLFIRRSDNLLIDPNFVRNADGTFVWYLEPFDTALIQTDVAFGAPENHLVYLRFGWDSATNGSLTDPFATALGSKTVTVTHAAHGLAVGDSIVFVGSSNVGSLDLSACWIVTRVIDANSYEFEHHLAAAAAATGGGAVGYFANGQTGSGTYSFSVLRIEP